MITLPARALPDGRTYATDGSQPMLPSPLFGHEQSLLAGWSITRVWYRRLRSAR